MRSADESVAVLLGRFVGDHLSARGLEVVIRTDWRLRILGVDLEAEAIVQRVSEPPCVAVLDGTESSLGVLTKIRSMNPTVGIVVVAHRPGREWRRRLFLDRVTCLPRDAAPEQIVQAVHSAGIGEARFWQSGASQVPVNVPGQLAALTRREREVYGLLRDGHTYGRIATALRISSDTARWHSRRVLRKLGVESRWDVVGGPLIDGREHEASSRP